MRSYKLILTLELHARLESSIEENVSLEALVAAKLETARRFDALGARTAAALAAHKKAAILLMGISTLILGTQSKKAKSLLNSASLPAEITEFQSHFWDDRGFKTLTSTLGKGFVQAQVLNFFINCAHAE